MISRVRFACVRRSRALLLASGALALTAFAPACTCKPDEKTPGTQVAPVVTKAPAGDTRAPVTRGVTALANERFTDGEILGHVLVPNFARLLRQTKEQGGTPQTSAFIDESFLRSMASGALGKRGALAQGIALDRPFGCAMIDPETHENPLACVLSYRGGIERFIKDLGAEGKQPDGKGHLAHYTIEGDELYVDALGDAIVVTGHPDVYELSEAYVQDVLVARGPKVATEIEVVAYPAKIVARYPEKLAALTADADPPPRPSGAHDRLDRAVAKWQEHTRKQTNGFRVAEMQQISLGLGFEKAGLVLRVAVFPKAGTALAEDAAAGAATGPLDAELVRSLPEGSWLVAGWASNYDSIFAGKSMAARRHAWTESYAEYSGKNLDDIDREFTAAVEESRAIYGKHAALALLHVPGERWALVSVVSLKPGVSGRSSWATWSKTFTAKNILDAETRKLVEWSFPAADPIEGVAIDRWEIRVTDEGARRMVESGNDGFSALKRMLGDELTIIVDRAELEGRAVFTVRPKSSVQATTIALAAQRGRGVLTNASGVEKLFGMERVATLVLGIDVKRLLTWLREIAPQDMAKVPRGFGKDLSDFAWATTYTKDGVQVGQIALSQSLIDQLRTHAVPQGVLAQP